MPAKCSYTRPIALPPTLWHMAIPPDLFFPYAIDKRWTALMLALRVGEKDGVTLTADGILLATFGRIKLETALSNVEYTEVTGPHRWYTAVGLRGSLVDDGVTFGTNHRSGLCIAFKERVPRVIGLRDHSGLWVSVADPAGLGDAIGC